MVSNENLEITEAEFSIIRFHDALEGDIDVYHYPPPMVPPYNVPMVRSQVDKNGYILGYVIVNDEERTVTGVTTDGRVTYKGVY